MVRTFYGFAFGLAWGLGYYLDNPNLPLQKTRNFIWRDARYDIYRQSHF